MIAMFSVHYILAVRWLHLVPRYSLAYSSGNLIMTTSETGSSGALKGWGVFEMGLEQNWNSCARFPHPRCSMIRVSTENSNPTENREKERVMYVQL